MEESNTKWKLNIKVNNRTLNKEGLEISSEQFILVKNILAEAWQLRKNYPREEDKEEDTQLLLDLSNAFHQGWLIFGD